MIWFEALDVLAEPFASALVLKNILQVVLPYLNSLAPDFWIERLECCVYLTYAWFKNKHSHHYTCNCSDRHTKHELHIFQGISQVWHFVSVCDERIDHTRVQ